jgi:hypothetical protein
LGYILGDFFTNSSGHPDGTAQKKMDWSYFLCVVPYGTNSLPT